jgi:hypothetical protein
MIVEAFTEYLIETCDMNCVGAPGTDFVAGEMGDMRMT